MHRHRRQLSLSTLATSTLNDTPIYNLTTHRIVATLLRLHIPPPEAVERNRQEGLAAWDYAHLSKERLQEYLLTSLLDKVEEERDRERSAKRVADERRQALEASALASEAARHQDGTGSDSEDGQLARAGNRALSLAAELQVDKEIGTPDRKFKQSLTVRREFDSYHFTLLPHLCFLCSSPAHAEAACDADVINLAEEGLEYEDWDYVCQLLESNAAARALHVSLNSLGAKGAQRLAKLLAANTTLTELNLGDTGIGDGGAAAIASIVERRANTSLQTLILSSCAISDTGAGAIARMLAGNKHIVALDLAGNRIEEGGAKSLAEALSQNTSLTALALHGNAWGEAGTEALLDAVLGNPPLTRNMLRTLLQ